MFQHLRHVAVRWFAAHHHISSAIFQCVGVHGTDAFLFRPTMQTHIIFFFLPSVSTCWRVRARGLIVGLSCGYLCVQYVGMYGTAYFQSSKATSSLFTLRDVENEIENDLMQHVIDFWSLAIGGNVVSLAGTHARSNARVYTFVYVHA